MVNVIHAIEGRKVTTRDVDDDPVTPKTITEYIISPEAEVEIDGRKDRTVSQLELGDEVVIGHPSRKEGFRTVVAKRLTRERNSTVAPPEDLSKSKVLTLEDVPPPHPPVPLTRSEASVPPK